ncbi:MAG: MFS transporter [Rickettsiales bacterium]
MSTGLSLLTKRRFLPLFVAQFLGAFNDNVFKNAMVILLTFHGLSSMPNEKLLALAAGLFILPFFLFSAMAGQIADKYDKARMIRIIRFTELPCMVFGSVSFFTGNEWVMLAALFFLGIQATFFGPIKYGVLPEILPEDELLGGNGLVEAGTFLAILIGTITGGLLILRENGMIIVSLVMVSASLISWGASYFLPRGTAADPELKIGWNIASETWKLMKYARVREDVFLCIIGISWFWLIGATFLAQFPAYIKDFLHADETVVTLFLTIFSLGIGIGSILCNALMKGRIHGSYVPYGSLGMTLFIFIIYFASRAYDMDPAAPLQNFMGFLTNPENFPILISMLLLAISGGIFIVPLYAIMQSRTEKAYRSRVVASNNVINALFMVLSSVLTYIMSHLDFTLLDVFLTIGVVNVPVTWLIRKLVVDQQAKQKAQGQ